MTDADGVIGVMERCKINRASRVSRMASPGLGRELTSEEHIALLKERNAKAREAMNGLVAENAQLRAELGR